MRQFLGRFSRKALLIGSIVIGVVLLTGIGLAAAAALSAAHSGAPQTASAPTSSSTPTAQGSDKVNHLVRVVSVNGNTLTVATGADKKSQQKTLTTSASTKITKYGQPAQLSDLQPDEWIMVHGTDATHIQQIAILGFGAQGAIQSINGSTLTVLMAKKAGTGTVNVNVSSSTHIMEGGVQVSLSDLQANESILAFGNKNSDGSLNAMLIRVKLVSGQVGDISGNTITLTHGNKGAQISVTTSSATKYYVGGKQVPASTLQVNDTIGVAGPLANKTSVTATAIFIQEPKVAGKVTSVNGNTIMVQTKNGVTWTVTADSSTQYLKAGQPASLADVQQGSLVEIVGMKIGDNALTAVVVRIHAHK